MKSRTMFRGAVSVEIDQDEGYWFLEFVVKEPQSPFHRKLMVVNSLGGGPEWHEDRSTILSAEELMQAMDQRELVFGAGEGRVNDER